MAGWLMLRCRFSLNHNRQESNLNLVKATRYNLGFLVFALVTLLTAIGAPVAAQGAAGEGEFVHYEHEGHCHLVSDCDAASSAGHAGPAFHTSVAFPFDGQYIPAVALQEASFGNFSEPVPTPPPIA